VTVITCDGRMKNSGENPDNQKRCRTTESRKEYQRSHLVSYCTGSTVLVTTRVGANDRWMDARGYCHVESLWVSAGNTYTAPTVWLDQCNAQARLYGF
jgi:hypothetical protein